jgi:hypothetical protein
MFFPRYHSTGSIQEVVTVTNTKTMRKSSVIKDVPGSEMRASEKFRGNEKATRQQGGLFFKGE